MGDLKIIIPFVAVGAFWLGRWFGKAAQKKKESEVLKSISRLLTKHDLKESEQRILMKLSEVKTLVAAAAGKSEEAFGEIGIKIAALQQQIDDLINGAGDPDVTDEAFLADLNKLKAQTDALADVVPNPATP